MAQQLTTDSQIDGYVDDAQKAADHHGPAVDKIVQPLADAVRLKLNLKRDRVEVYLRNGVLGRTCWVTIKGRKCVCTYDHPTRKISVKDHSIRGPVLFQCDNRTSAQAIINAINRIWP